MPLPDIRPLRQRDIVRFELTGALPGALPLLRRYLSPGAGLRFVVHLLRAGSRDPLVGIPPLHPDRQRERLARRQFRGLLLLEDGLIAAGLPTPERLQLLRELMATAGASFIARNLPLPTRANWQAADEGERRRFLTRLTRRFINADIDAIQTSKSGLGFDVTRCLFAELAHAVGRPHLAPLFCLADEVYFNRPGSLVQLSRTQTLAEGHERCDFRFHHRQ